MVFVKVPIRNYSIPLSLPNCPPPQYVSLAHCGKKAMKKMSILSNCIEPNFIPLQASNYKFSSLMPPVANVEPIFQPLFRMPAPSNIPELTRTIQNELNIITPPKINMNESIKSHDFQDESNMVIPLSLPQSSPIIHPPSNIPSVQSRNNYLSNKNLNEFNDLGVS